MLAARPESIEEWLSCEYAVFSADSLQAAMCLEAELTAPSQPKDPTCISASVCCVLFSFKPTGGFTCPSLPTLHKETTSFEISCVLLPSFRKQRAAAGSATARSDSFQHDTIWNWKGRWLCEEKHSVLVCGIISPRKILRLKPKDNVASYYRCRAQNLSHLAQPK